MGSIKPYIVVIDCYEKKSTSVPLGVVGLDCLISHELCLTPADLEYLLQTRRENKNSGLWELTKHSLENTSTLEQDTKEGREGTKRQLGNKENLNEIVYGARTFSSSKQPSELTDGERKEKQNILVEEEGKGRKVVHTLNTKSDDEEKQENERNSDEVVNVKDDCYNDADCNKAAGVGDSGGFVMIYPSPVGHLYDQVRKEGNVDEAGDDFSDDDTNINGDN